MESSADPKGLPSWDVQPTDAEAQRAGFKSAEDLQCHAAGVTPAGRESFLVDLASSKQADETREPDDYDPHRLASSVAALQDLWAWGQRGSWFSRSAGMGPRVGCSRV